MNGIKAKLVTTAGAAGWLASTGIAPLSTEAAATEDSWRLNGRPLISIGGGLEESRGNNALKKAEGSRGITKFLRNTIPKELDKEITKKIKIKIPRTRRFQKRSLGSSPLKQSHVE